MQQIKQSNFKNRKLNFEINKDNKLILTNFV